MEELRAELARVRAVRDQMREELGAMRDRMREEFEALLRTRNEANMEGHENNVVQNDVQNEAREREEDASE